MAENDEKHKKEHREDIDHFSRFMFGESNNREVITESENLPKLEENTSFDDWLFGGRGKDSTTKPESIEAQIVNFLNNVDVDLLMETIEMFLTTSKQLQPILKEITPYLNQFNKKRKSK